MKNNLRWRLILSLKSTWNYISLLILMLAGCSDDDVSVSLPVVSTVSVSNVTVNSAKSGGNVTHDGGVEVIARGVCWSTQPNPSLSDNITTDGVGVGTYESVLSNLEPLTQYYVRAYAKNSVGTSYGEQVEFTTLDYPGEKTFTLNSEINCEDKNCQDVFEFSFIKGAKVNFSVSNVTNGGVIQIALYAPLTEPGGTNLFSGNTKEIGCTYSSCNDGKDGFNFGGFVIPESGVYLFAVTRNHGESCNDFSNFNLQVTSDTNFVYERLAFDDVISDAPEEGLCL
jgi:hypothetical protein